MQYLPDGRTVKRPGNDFMPSFTDNSGANYFDRDSMFLHVVSVITNFCFLFSNVKGIKII